MACLYGRRGRSFFFSFFFLLFSLDVSDWTNVETFNFFGGREGGGRAGSIGSRNEQGGEWFGLCSRLKVSDAFLSKLFRQQVYSWGGGDLA